MNNETHVKCWLTTGPLRVICEICKNSFDCEQTSSLLTAEKKGPTDLCYNVIEICPKCMKKLRKTSKAKSETFTDIDIPKEGNHSEKVLKTQRKE